MGLVLEAPPGTGSSSFITLAARRLGATLHRVAVWEHLSLGRAESEAISESRRNPMALRWAGLDPSRPRVILLDNADAVFQNADTRQDMESSAPKVGSSLEEDQGGAVVYDRHITFREWAESDKTSPAHSPIVLIVKSLDSRSIRSLLERNPRKRGWKHVRLFAPSAKQTAFILSKTLGRLGVGGAFEHGNAYARMSPGNVKQALLLASYSKARSGPSTLGTLLNGNLFLATSFILSGGRASQFGRVRPPPIWDSLQSFHADPRVIDAVRDNVPAIMGKERGGIEEIADSFEAFSMADACASPQDGCFGRSMYTGSRPWTNSGRLSQLAKIMVALTHRGVVERNSRRHETASRLQVTYPRSIRAAESSSDMYRAMVRAKAACRDGYNADVIEERSKAKCDEDSCEALPDRIRVHIDPSCSADQLERILSAWTETRASALKRMNDSSDMGITMSMVREKNEEEKMGYLAMYIEKKRAHSLHLSSPKPK